LDERSDHYLSFKYTYAKTNGNDLTFYSESSTSNGRAAGPGLYCGKSPSDSYSYGDRLIRVDLVQDVVMLDSKTNIKYCGFDGETSKTSGVCAKKNWDIKFYRGGSHGEYAWYVIQNPMAVERWSANSDQLVSDLKENILLNDTDFKTHAEKTIKAIERERLIMGEQKFYNERARYSIVDIILKTPDKIDSMPPINIISQLSSSNTDKLSEAEKDEIYKRQMLRAMGSNETAFEDIHDLANINPGLEKILIESVNHGLKDVKNFNSFIILAMISKHPDEFKDVPPESLNYLIGNVFKNQYFLAELSKSSLQLNGSLKTLALNELNQLASVVPDFKNTMTTLAPTVIKKLSSGEEVNLLKRKWESNLFSSDMLNFGLKIADKSYFFKNHTLEVKGQCLAAIALTDLEKPGDAHLLFRNSEIKLEGDSVDAQCSSLSKFIETLIHYKMLERNVPLFVVRGRVETTPFVFLARTIEDIDQQCRIFYPSVSNPSRVQEIFVSVNDSAELNEKISMSYWKTVDEVCNNVNKLASHTVPSRNLEELEIERDQWLAKKAASGQSGTGYLIEGKFEYYPFIFFGEYRDDIHAQCLKYFPSIPNTIKIKEFFWKIDSSISGKVNSSFSYWSSATAVCNALEIKIKPHILSQKETENQLKKNEIIANNRDKKKANPSGFLIEAKIEGHDLNLFGIDGDEIYDQCLTLLPLIPTDGKIDAIAWNINSTIAGNSRNTSFFGKTVPELCQNLRSDLTPYVPTKNKIARENQNAKFAGLKANSQSGYSVTGRFNKNSFYFFGQNKEEILGQCSEFYKYLDDSHKINQIYVGINDSTERHIKNSYYYWNSKEALCGQIAEATKSIPTKEELKHQAPRNVFIKSIQELEKQSPGVGYRVTGTIGNIDYYFYGDFFEQIEQQCKDFSQYLPGDSLTSIQISINGIPTSFSRSFAWSNQTCAVISNSIRRKIQTKEEVIKSKGYQDKLNLLNQMVQKNSQDAEDSSPSYKISGNLGDLKYFFYGNNLDEISAQCEVYKKLVPQGGVISEIDLHFNESDLKKIPYQKSAYIFCDWLRTEVAFKVPGQEEVLFQQQDQSFLQSYEASSAPHKGIVKIHNRFFYFHANYSEQIKQQCMDFYPQMNLNSTDIEVLYTLSDTNIERTTITNGSDRELCEGVENLFKKTVLNQVEFERLEREEFERNRPKIRIIGTFGAIKFEFNGNTIDTIENECQSKYADLLEENERNVHANKFWTDLEWTLNELREFSDIKSRGNPRKDRCKDLIKSLKKVLIT
jgi:hypothetical protein